jgi:hypothetical protein
MLQGSYYFDLYQKGVFGPDQIRSSELLHIDGNPVRFMPVNPRKIVIRHIDLKDV